MFVICACRNNPRFADETKPNWPKCATFEPARFGNTTSLRRWKKMKVLVANWTQLL